MRFIIPLGLALIVLAAPLAPPSAQSSGGGACLVPSSLFPTIQSAINNATCLEIDVAPGIYIENLAINRNLEIKGANEATTIIDGGGTDTVVKTLGGDVTICFVTIRNGKTNSDGGGILNQAPSLLLCDSIVTNNQGGYGGGIEGFGALDLQNDTISGNTAATGCGGGVNVANNLATLYLFNSTIERNHAIDATLGNGGGICNSGAVTVTNSTISANTASRSGGGIENGATGSLVSLYNVTIAANVADADSNGTGRGGGVHNISGAIFHFRNTILADNVQGMTGDDCAGTLDSQDYNLVLNGGGTCTINGLTGHLITGKDPLLGPLQNNGGLTDTHALLVGSPAIDAGNPAGCIAPSGIVLTTDQRGYPRPYPPGGRCDMGAFEYNLFLLHLPLLRR